MAPVAAHDYSTMAHVIAVSHLQLKGSRCRDDSNSAHHLPYEYSRRTRTKILPYVQPASVPRPLLALILLGNPRQDHQRPHPHTNPSRTSTKHAPPPSQIEQPPLPLVADLPLFNRYTPRYVVSTKGILPLGLSFVTLGCLLHNPSLHYAHCQVAVVAQRPPCPSFSRRSLGQTYLTRRPAPRQTPRDQSMTTTTTTTPPRYHGRGSGPPWRHFCDNRPGQQ